VPTAGELHPMYGSLPLYPASGPPPVVRRPRGLPSLLWLLLGVALGACVVMMVIMFAFPDAFNGSQANGKRTLVASHDASRGATAEPTVSTASTGSRTTPELSTIRPRESGRADSAQNEPTDRQLIQAIIREEIRRERGEVERQPMADSKISEAPATTRRWMSGRPPPIDDPGDDSPGLGLKVADRTARQEATQMFKAAAMTGAARMATDSGPFNDDAKPAAMPEGGEPPRAGDGVTLRRALVLRKADGGGVQLSRETRATLVRFDGDNALVSVEVNGKDPVQGHVPIADLNFGGKTVKPDSTAAIQALTAAQIKCDKNPDTGLIERVDGSFKMTDALMEHVAKLPNVAVLKLSFSNVKNDGLAHIKELAGLRELILNETKVTDFGIAHLAGLTELEKLDLEKAPVSDDSLDTLKQLRKLKHLDLRGTIVTPAGVTELEEALPSAKIRR
jgi:hypothetical protein